MPKRIAISRRYWFWQRRRMRDDDIGYTVAYGLYDELRPLAVKWINVTDVPGGLTEIPSGWRPAPAIYYQNA